MNFIKNLFNFQRTSLTKNIKTPYRNLFIQTETTPNINSLKFKPGVDVQKYKKRQLEIKLGLIKGVEGVFFGPDFVSVNKYDDVNWAHIKPDIYASLMEFFSNDVYVLGEGEGEQRESSIGEEDSEVVLMIKELLDTRIRPAVNDDGGDVEFVSFKDGILQLKMLGSCKGCASSSVTLKQGIEGMMKVIIIVLRLALYSRSTRGATSGNRTR
jgi:Fe-S cluster biogenesis protein NfuA